MRERETPEVGVIPSASCTVAGEREAGKGAEVKTERRLKAVGVPCKRGARVPSLPRAEWRAVISSEGRSGAGPDKKPTDLSARRWRSASRKEIATGAGFGLFLVTC